MVNVPPQKLLQFRRNIYWFASFPLWCIAICTMFLELQGEPSDFQVALKHCFREISGTEASSVPFLEASRFDGQTQKDMALVFLEKDSFFKSKVLINVKFVR